MGGYNKQENAMRQYEGSEKGRGLENTSKEWRKPNIVEHGG